MSAAVYRQSRCLERGRMGAEALATVQSVSGRIAIGLLRILHQGPVMMRSG